MMDTDTARAQAEPGRHITYQIRVEGHLGEQWAAWFEGMTISLEAGDTLLCGDMSDQARLFGMLKKVRDLGLPLVSVSRVPSSTTHYSERITFDEGE